MFHKKLNLKIIIEWQIVQKQKSILINNSAKNIRDTEHKIYYINHIYYIYLLTLDLIVTMFYFLLKLLLSYFPILYMVILDHHNYHQY